MIKKYLSLATYIVVIGAVGAWLLWFGGHQGGNTAANKTLQSSEATLASYVNAKGQTWKIPKGEYDFTVASGGTYPKFVIGFINPLDVKVGDTQKMMIAVNGDQPLTRVWAEVETDKETHTVEMSLDATSTVSYGDLMKQKYLVDNNGKLIINQGDPGWKRIVDSVVESAKAEGRPVLQYTYVGQWKVADTHTKTYHTRFVAEDASGRKDSMTLAWSDPVCEFDGAGNLIGSCSITNSTEGADTAMSISNATVNVGTSSIFAFPPGGSISLGVGGNITLNSTGSIQRKYLYYTDADRDGYAANAAMSTSNDAGDATYGRMTTDSTKIRVSKSADLNLNATGYPHSGASVAWNGSYQKLAERNDLFGKVAGGLFGVPTANANVYEPPCYLESGLTDCIISPPPTRPTPNVAWSNLTSVADGAGANGTYASVTYGASFSSQWMRLNDFRFTSGSIPDYADIDSISIAVRGYKANTNAVTMNARLSYYDATNAQWGTSASQLTSTSLGTGVSTITLSGATSTWALALKPSNIWDTNFGVVLSMDATGANTIYIDSVGMTVNYTVRGVKKTATLTAIADCYDSNALAHPGQTAWFSDNRGDGSYDYDCNGISDQAFTVTGGSCLPVAQKQEKGGDYLSFLVPLVNTAFAQPWNGGSYTTPQVIGWSSPSVVPACGAAASFVWACNSTTALTYSKTQLCR